jgi:hypothetical protein
MKQAVESVWAKTASLRRLLASRDVLCWEIAELYGRFAARRPEPRAMSKFTAAKGAVFYGMSHSGA